MTDRQRERYEDARKAYDALMKYYPFTLEDLDGEEWRDVIGYERLYQESTFGRTKSFHKGTPKILKPACDKDGYLYVGLKRNGKNKNFKVHRLVAETFIPNIDNKPQVNHVDGHKFNCHVSNLEWATHKENMEHAAQIELIKIGEERFGAKLKNIDVAYIRENPDGLTTNKLAEMFGVSLAKIGDVQLGRKYKSVGGKIREKQIPSLKIPVEIRRQIRTEYVQGDLHFGAHALGRKYNCSTTTIWRIVHEQD